LEDIKQYHGSLTAIYHHRSFDTFIGLFLGHGNGVFLREQNQAEKYGYAWQKARQGGA
jgi:hypothetical protein